MTLSAPASPVAMATPIMFTKLCIENRYLRRLSEVFSLMSAVIVGNATAPDAPRKTCPSTMNLRSLAMVKLAMPSAESIRENASVTRRSILSTRMPPGRNTMTAVQALTDITMPT